MCSTRSVLILCLFFILIYVESASTLHVGLERKIRALTESGSASRLGAVDAISCPVSTASLVSPSSPSSSNHSTSSSTSSWRATKSRLTTSSGTSKKSRSFTTLKPSATSTQYTKSRLSTTSRSSITSGPTSTSSNVSRISTSSTSSSAKSNIPSTFRDSSSTQSSLFSISSFSSLSSSSTKPSPSLTFFSSSSTKLVSYPTSSPSSVTSSLLSSIKPGSSSISSTSSSTPSITTPLIITEKYRTTYTVAHYHTVAVGIGAWVLGGIAGGVAAVGDFLFDIAEGDLDFIEEDDDGDPEISIESQPTTETTKTTSTSSTTSSMPISTQYLILPQDGLTLNQQENLLNALQKLSLKPVESTLRNNGSAYWWLATLTVENAAAVSENPAVMLCFKDRTFVPDAEAPTSLKEIQQRSNPLNDTIEEDWTPNDFVRYSTDDLPLKQLSTPETWVWDTGTYDSFHTGGSGITVFVVDSGANMYSPEYVSLGRRVRWLENVEPWMHDEDEYNHGTCVLSKVAGATYGSAKAADIIVVKIATLIWQISWMCDGFAKVLNEVKKERMQGKAVVNVSFGSPGRIENRFDEMEIVTMWLRIKELIDNDVVIVAGSGNYPGRSDDVDEIPQRFAYPQRLQYLRRTLPALPIILVGSVVERGIRSRFSQGTTILTISARGDGMCASGEHPGPDSEHRVGTSFSAPMISGLVAQILAAPAFYSYPRSPLAPGETQQEMKAYIENLGYPKDQPDLMNSAWNGVDVKCGPRNPKGPVPPPPRGSKLKVRQVVKAAACPAQTITTTTSVIDTVTSISTEALTTVLTTVIVVTVTITSTITTTVVTSTTTVWVPSSCGCSCLSAGDDSDYCSSCEGWAAVMYTNFAAAGGVLMQLSPTLTGMATTASSSASPTLTGVLIPSATDSINTGLSTVTDVVTETLNTTITITDSDVVTNMVTQMSTVTTTSTSTSTTDIVSMSCTVCEPGTC